MSKLAFEKLNDTNYTEWSMQMEALLDEQDLWDVVNGTETKPNIGPNAKATKTLIRKQWLTKAKSFFTSPLPNSLMLINNDGPGLPSVQDLSFHLKSASFDVNETIVIVTLLRGLPPEYSPLITTIGATPTQ
ncbi:hypothetical protein DFH29DRAFT_997633 [Suillus ampliporus]|nr:hypothetical protein DFH29DRAFT_997633 [Suillus ampliporus]